jgi:hypothetical protein
MLSLEDTQVKGPLMRLRLERAKAKLLQSIIGLCVLKREYRYTRRN